MGDSDKSNDRSSFLRNPWVLNFQKLGLELKCPLCLNLLNRPMLLPCNHTFCSNCLPVANQFGSECDCPVCKAPFVDRDLRPLPFMENLATIYKCLDSSCSANLHQPICSDVGVVPWQSPHSTTVKSNSQSGHSIDKDENCPVPIDVKGRIDFSNAVNPNSTLPKSFTSSGASEECTIIDINPVAQAAPLSPPSFGDAKGSDNEGYPSSEHNSGCSLVEKRSTQEKDLRHLKRQKKMYHESVKFGVSSDERLKPVSFSGTSMTNSEPEPHTTSQPISAPKLLDDQSANRTICVFCQSSKISEATGPILHYSSGSGKLVVGNEASLPKVIHVHKVCIDWAPKVYYVGDAVRNLKEEVVRGAKLKCTKCGLKGAALGCYVKSCRRSYHVPCALEISKCRWNYEHFLLLCPVHSSSRFPNEKKSGKCITKIQAMPTSTICHATDNGAASPNLEKKVVFCGSGLSTEEKILLVKFGKMIGATVSKFWNPDVTHVIAATDEKGACTRTLKVLFGILNASWIVNVDWVKACMEAKCRVDEEPYEVGLDNYGCCGGPKTGRLRALSNEPKLFIGLSFHFVGEFVPSYKEDLEELVIAAGGTVLHSGKELTGLSCETAASRSLVVYNTDVPEETKLGEEVTILWKRLNEAHDVATNKTASQIVGHTWLLESIAGCKLQPLPVVN
ncbi:hypothetical protein UlMin_031715 [Ulmus minor]